MKVFYTFIWIFGEKVIIKQIRSRIKEIILNEFFHASMHKYSNIDDAYFKSKLTFLSRADVIFCKALLSFLSSSLKRLQSNYSELTPKMRTT